MKIFGYSLAVLLAIGAGLYLAFFHNPQSREQEALNNVWARFGEGLWEVLNLTTLGQSAPRPAPTLASSVQWFPGQDNPPTSSVQDPCRPDNAQKRIHVFEIENRQTEYIRVAVHLRDFQSIAQAPVIDQAFVCNGGWLAACDKFQFLVGDNQNALRDRHKTLVCMIGR